MDSKHSIALVIGALFVLIAGTSRPAYAAPPSDPCSLLTQSQVSAVLGVQVGDGQRVAPTLCEWAMPGASPSLSQKKVTITLQTEQGFAAAKVPVGGAITKVPSVMTQFSAQPPSSLPTLAVKKGNFFFIVHIFGFPLDQPKAVDEVQAKEKTLALQILSKL
jgi:hypothetical protein